MPRILIGLGSNIDPENHLNAAAVMLREEWPTIQFSNVYESKPWGMEDQQDFLNAVGIIDATEQAHEIVEFLKKVEEKREKNVTVRFGPRTLDLDLLLYGNDVLPDHAEWQKTTSRTDVSHTLILPHPRMHERRFVLEPLLELINPFDLHPALKESWQELLEKTKQQEVRRMPMQL